MKRSHCPVVLVTGGSRGIGRGIAIEAADMGCSVAVNFVRDEESAATTLMMCEQQRKTKKQMFSMIKADISSDNGRAFLLDKAINDFGRVDALVNNAGIPPRRRTDLTKISIQSFMEVMRVNLEAPFFLTQMLANYWLKKKVNPLLPSGFNVINISSISATTVSIDRGEYCISKAGLAMVSKLWAARLAGESIQVYEIRPGIIRTGMTNVMKDKYAELIRQGGVPQRRWGTPKDVGLVVKSILLGFLPYSTGEIIYVDGGFHMSRL